MANEVVGQAGVQAIRDFIKPYVINYSSISNTSSLATIGSSNISPLLGKTSLKYTGTIASATLTAAVTQNFGKVTEYNGAPTFVVNKTGDNKYSGIQYNGTSSGNRLYVIQAYPSSGYCDVFVYGITVTYNSIDLNNVTCESASGVFELTNLFTFSSAEQITIYGTLMGYNSFMFTKTESGNFYIGEDLTEGLFTMPIDMQSYATGVVKMNYCGSTATNNGYTFYGQGDSWFFNRHQKWQFSYDGTNKTIILINTQDVAIQCISASDYASLTTKDPNTLYFVPEE